MDEDELELCIWKMNEQLLARLDEHGEELRLLKQKTNRVQETSRRHENEDDRGNDMMPKRNGRACKKERGS